MFATRRAQRATKEVLVQRQEKAQDTFLKHHYSKRLSLCFVMCDTKLQTLVTKSCRYPQITPQRSKGCTCIKETELSVFSCVEVVNKHYFSTERSIHNIYLLTTY